MLNSEKNIMYVRICLLVCECTLIFFSFFNLPRLIGYMQGPVLEHIQLSFDVSALLLDAIGSFTHLTHIDKSTPMAQGMLDL